MRKQIGATSVAAVVALAVWPLLPRAFGQDTTQRVNVEVVAPSCTGNFGEELLAKTRNIALASDGSTVVRVIVTSQAGAFWGRLTIADERAGATGVISRELRAERCDDVLRGLALVAALALDPPRSAAARADAGFEASSDTIADAGFEASSDAIADAAPPAPAPSEVLAPPLASPSPLAFVVGPTAETSSRGPSPTWMLGGFVTLGAPEGRAPLARFSAAASFDTDATSSRGRATLAWYVGSLGGCPFGFALGQRVELQPCVGLELGVLRSAASGDGLLDATPRLRFWSAGQASVRLAIDVRPLTIAVLGGVLVPITRETLGFRVDTGSFERVYVPPSVAGLAAVDLGVRFW